MPLTIYRDKRAKLREDYKLSTDSPVTAMLWERGLVRINSTFANRKPSREQRIRFVKGVVASLEP